MRPRPGTAIRSTDRFTLVASVGGTWAAVEGIRLAGVDVVAAVAEVDAFLRETGTRIASWWLSEHSTPDDLERRLLASGLRVLPDDYLVDGMLLTSAPPPPESDIEARPAANAEEFVEATLAQYEAFETPANRRHTRAELEARFARDDDVLFVARLAGRIAGAARSSYASCGVLLTGGATLPWARGRGAYRALVRARWDDAVVRGTPALTVGAGAMSAPILRRLGFESVCPFRRLQYDLPEA